MTMWQPSVCLNFLDELLTWIRKTVVKDDPKYVHVSVCVCVEYFYIMYIPEERDTILLFPFDPSFLAYIP